MAFNKWLDTFLQEKGIDGEDRVEANGPSGVNSIPVASLAELMKQAPAHEQAGIKTTLIKVDFLQPGKAPVMRYLAHLAQAVAV